MNNDLGFLIVFIVLPTVLVVSGFWLALFVRNDARDKGMNASAIQSAENRSSDVAIAIADEPPRIIPSRPSPSVAAASTVERREKFWTPLELVDSDIPTPATNATAVPETSESDSPEANKFSDTAQIEPVEPPKAAKPEDRVIEGDSDEDDSSSVPAKTSKVEAQRKPTARMIPSTDNVVRRTGATARRTPPILRSFASDKDIVERADGV